MLPNLFGHHTPESLLPSTATTRPSSGPSSIFTAGSYQPQPFRSEPSSTGGLAVSRPQSTRPTTARSQFEHPVTPRVTSHCVKDCLCKCTVGVTLMVIGGICWACIALLMETTYNEPSFEAPFFIVYISTAWLTLLYPACVVTQFLRNPKEFSWKKTWHHDTVDVIKLLCHFECKMQLLFVILKWLGFSVLLTSAAYSYARAFGFGKAHDVTAKFVLYSNFHYIFSWLILEKKFVVLRIPAVLLGMIGVIFLTYPSDEYRPTDVWRCLLVMFAAVQAAACPVLMQLVISDKKMPKRDHMALFLSLISVLSVLVMWPILLGLHLSGAEEVTGGKVPWLHVCGIASCSLVFFAVFIFGASVTYPVFIGATLLVAYPICLVTAVVLGDDLLTTGLQYAAYLLIPSGFLLNHVPASVVEYGLKKLGLVQEELIKPGLPTPRQQLRRAEREDKTS